MTTPEPELPANHLSSLLVTYTLDGRADIPATMWSPTAFMPSDGGPYTVSIPHGAKTCRSPRFARTTALR